MMPSFAKGGDVYALHVKIGSTDFLIEGYHWRNICKYISSKNNIRKVYCNVILGKGTEYSTKFKRNIYTLLKSVDSEYQGVIVHYTGDNTTYVAKPHGHANKNMNVFAPTMASARAN